MINDLSELHGLRPGVFETDVSDRSEADHDAAAGIADAVTIHVRSCYGIFDTEVKAVGTAKSGQTALCDGIDFTGSQCFAALGIVGITVFKGYGETVPQLYPKLYPKKNGFERTMSNEAGFLYGTL